MQEHVHRSKLLAFYCYQPGTSAFVWALDEVRRTRVCDSAVLGCVILLGLRCFCCAINSNNWPRLIASASCNTLWPVLSLDMAPLQRQHCHQTFIETQSLFCFDTDQSAMRTQKAYLGYG